MTPNGPLIECRNTVAYDAADSGWFQDGTQNVQFDVRLDVLIDAVTGTYCGEMRATMGWWFTSSVTCDDGLGRLTNPLGGIYLPWYAFPQKCGNPGTRGWEVEPWQVINTGTGEWQSEGEGESVDNVACCYIV
jgi:hypothetical protein